MALGGNCGGETYQQLPFLQHLPRNPPLTDFLGQITDPRVRLAAGTGRHYRRPFHNKGGSSEAAPPAYDCSQQFNRSLRQNAFIVEYRYLYTRSYEPDFHVFTHSGKKQE